MATMTRGTHELSAAETSTNGTAVSVFRRVRPLRRYRRLVLQCLMTAVLLVGVTVLLSTHHRQSQTTSGPIGPAADTLRRFVRSVREESSSSGRLIIGDDGSNGFLVNVDNGSRLADVEFRSYGDAVDLRLIVLAYNRPQSLAACLESIDAAEYSERDRLALHVWIDGCPDDDEHDDEAHKKTIDVAQSFNFSHGTYHVHVRPQHVGVQVGDVCSKYAHMCLHYQKNHWLAVTCLNASITSARYTSSGG